MLALQRFRRAPSARLYGAAAAFFETRLCETQPAQLATVLTALARLGAPVPPRLVAA
jgi:hypothetical protein